MGRLSVSDNKALLPTLRKVSAAPSNRETEEYSFLRGAWVEIAVSAVTR